MTGRGALRPALVSTLGTLDATFLNHPLFLSELFNVLGLSISIRQPLGIILLVIQIPCLDKLDIYKVEIFGYH